MDSVSVTWYGQAGFRLAAGDSRVLIDPFLTDRPRPIMLALP
jgi:L-ascorbate metabolism protein UlaG (beta-lactamase superfamily)